MKIKRGECKKQTFRGLKQGTQLGESFNESLCIYDHPLQKPLLVLEQNILTQLTPPFPVIIYVTNAGTSEFHSGWVILQRGLGLFFLTKAAFFVYLLYCNTHHL